MVQEPWVNAESRSSPNICILQAKGSIWCVENGCCWSVVFHAEVGTLRVRIEDAPVVPAWLRDTHPEIWVASGELQSKLWIDGNPGLCARGFSV